jgi:hypothetical protein
MAKKSKKKNSKLSLKLRGKVKKPVTALATTEEEPLAPRITSDTVAEHREEILAGARRFIYPLQHSKHKVVVISSTIVALVIFGSLMLSSLMLYRYQSTNRFAYRISQIIPFPVTKVDGDWVPYENYLFELNYSLFYHENNDQEGVDINSSEGQLLVQQLKVKALEKVKLDAMAKKLADENGIKVTDEQIQKQIELIRNNGGIGDSDETFNEILRSSYNWNVDDLERTIRLQLTRQSLPRVLDTKTIETANFVEQRLADGGKFEDLVKKYSDDELTADKAGVIGLISKTDTLLPPEFIEAAFSLEEGQTSALVETRFGLHIIRVNKIEGDQREVAHILLRYFDVEQFLNDELSKVEVVDYIHFD